MNIVIRDATADDFPILFEISAIVHQRDYGGFIPADERAEFNARYELTDENRDSFVALCHERLALGTWHYVVATNEAGEILGYTQALQADEHHLVKRGMFVRPEYQGQGIGSHLMKISLEGVESGRVDLFVLKKNVRAQKLYEKYGFQSQGLADHTFFGAPLIKMSLKKP